MKTITTSTALKDFKGQALKNCDHELTIGDVISFTLSGKVSNPTLGWSLEKKFANEKTVDLKAEDIVFIKKELESTDGWNAIVTGQAIEVLEAKDEQKKA